MPDYSSILTILLVTIGPFKMLGPYAKIVKNADQPFIRKIALRATLYSIITLIIAAVLGERIVTKSAIPLPILALSGGIILFLVSLRSAIEQFEPAKPHQESAERPSPQVAVYPLTFPIIVTPYGIAAVIVFNTLSHDLNTKLNLGAMVAGIMVVNLLVMLFSKPIFKPLAVVLAILGAILNMLTVAFAAKIIYNNLTILLA